MHPDEFSDAAQVEKLHGIYCKSTRMEIQLTHDRIYYWWQWIKRGFTVEDLVMVLGYLRREIANRKRNPGALKFKNLVCDTEGFEEDLAMVRAANRPRKPATVQRTQQIGDINRTVEVPREDEDDSIDVGQLFADFREKLSKS